MLRINVVTLFPNLFREPFATSILGRAAGAGLVRYEVINLRDFTHDRHRTVDDSPYGGGAGMVMKPEPFYEALEDLGAGPPTVLLSARGRPFRHEDAVRTSQPGAMPTLRVGMLLSVATWPRQAWPWPPTLTSRVSGGDAVHRRRARGRYSATAPACPAPARSSGRDPRGPGSARRSCSRTTRRWAVHPRRR